MSEIANTTELVKPVHDFLIVNPETQEIFVPETEKMFGVYGDSNVERKYFKCPRIVKNNIDLATCKVYVNYMSMAGNYGHIQCTDRTVEEDCITFSWLLSSRIFDVNRDNDILFALQFVKQSVNEDGVSKENVLVTREAVGYGKHTVDGIEQIAQEYPDLLQQFIDRLEEVEDVSADWLAKKTVISPAEIIWPASEVNFTGTTKALAAGKGLIAGGHYIVTWNGEKYEMTAYMEEDDTICIGNSGLIGFSTVTDDPFVIYSLAGTSWCTVHKESSDTEAITIQIESVEVVEYNKMPIEYMPEEAQMRTHWIEKGGEIILQETVVAIGNDGLGEFAYSCNIEDGRPYVISYNGESYKVTAKQMGMEGKYGLLLGNSYPINGTDTGEPFALGYSPDVSAFLVILMDGTVSTDVTFSITTDDYVHTLDNKYLGILEEIPSNKVTWDGNTAGRDSISISTLGVYYKISDEVPRIEDFQNGGYFKVTANDMESIKEFPSDEISIWQSTNSSFSNCFSVLDSDSTFIIVVYGELAGYPDATPGIYALSITTDDVIAYVSEIVLNKPIPNIKKNAIKKEYIPPIPEECLPESVKSVVMRSSTAGSTKKFKITVDDSGTISAIEVTE